MSKIPHDTDIITIIRDDPIINDALAAVMSVWSRPLPPFGYRLPKPKKSRNPKKAAQKSQRLARKANRR